MTRLALGDKWSKASTVVTGLFLLATDIPDYLVVFLLVFLMAAFPVQGDTLDSITGLSKSRRAAFLIAVAIGLLCVPVPQTFVTFPL